jgi:hypothetical protein
MSNRRGPPLEDHNIRFLMPQKTICPKPRKWIVVIHPVKDIDPGIKIKGGYVLTDMILSRKKECREQLPKTDYGYLI